MIKSQTLSMNKLQSATLITAGTKAFVGGTSTVYARCDNMWQHINYAGAVTGDRMWRMPLFNDYADPIISKLKIVNSNFKLFPI